MKTYRSERSAFARINRLRHLYGIWTSAIRLPNGRYRLTFDFDD
jgi:hypothetical protein